MSEDTRTAALAEVADKNAKAAIQRTNEVEFKVAACVDTLQGLEKSVAGLIQAATRLEQQINLVRAQTSYSQLEPKLLPRILEELKLAEND